MDHGPSSNLSFSYISDREIVVIAKANGHSDGTASFSCKGASSVWGWRRLLHMEGGCKYTEYDDKG